MRQLLFFSLFSLLVSASALEKSEEVKLHALYLMQQNKVEEAINRYREYTHLTGHQDFEALQQMGIILLSKGIQDPDPQTYLMTLFGAGLSGSSNALDILESGLYQQDPNIQLLALHFISQFEEDKTSDLLNIAMGSDF